MKNAARPFYKSAGTARTPWPALARTGGSVDMLGTSGNDPGAPRERDFGSP
jgi:hypothetical protein